MAMRPEHQTLSYRELIEVLHTLSSAQRTGTVFIHDDSNHSVRIVLEQGRIISCAFGKYRGQEALPLIRRIRSGKYSFAEGMFNSASETPLPPTEELLRNFAGELELDAYAQSEPAPARSAVIAKQASTGVADKAAADSMPLMGNELYEAVVRELTAYIGPIARMVAADFEEAIEAASNSTQLRSVVLELAAQLGEPAQGNAFSNTVMSWVSRQ
jgi:hypothetical protein